MPIYKVKPGQNIFDVALHIYGNIEGLFDLLMSNPSLSMTSELHYEQELNYHEEFVLNESVVSEFKNQSIVPSSGERKVYFKNVSEPLIAIIVVDSESKSTGFKAAGEGVMIIDWGDNSDLETITLGNSLQGIEHYFDNEVEKRRIRLYGDTDSIKFTELDTTQFCGMMLLCRPLIVDEYTCKGGNYPIAGLALLRETYKVNLKNSTIESLLPIGDMNLQELDLTGVSFISIDVLDSYLEYIVSNYDDRRPCTIYMSQEPSEKGYAAINKILGEPEWNVSDTWKFYINNQLYQQSNG